MANLDLLLAFGAATLVFAVMPGPALLYTAAQTLARGRQGGMRAALGIHLGGFAHVLAAALGLASLFAIAPVLYSALKVIGAIYLIYLGIRIIFSKSNLEVSEADPKPSNGPFFQSVLVEVLNPKTALFFVAFLPQFVDPAAAFPVWVQFLILGTIVNIAFSCADVVAVFLTDTAVGWAKNNGAGQHIAKWAGGSVLIGLGAHLAFSRD